mgnify:CR=1 FL=1
MTLSDVIENFDSERSNNVSILTKKRWISQLDLKIWGEILKPRGDKEYIGYGKEIPLDAVVKAPEEYAEIYTLYMNMKLDYMNGEIGRYNNSVMLFNRMFKEMHDAINRATPVSQKTKIKAGDILV